MGILDTNLAGIAPFSVSSSPVSLTYDNVQQCMFRFTGTLTSSIIVSPAVGDATTYFNGFYLFENLTAGSFTITLQNGTGSVVLPQGRRGTVFVSTTNTLAPRIVSLVGSSTADPVPAGSSTLWYNTAAPSGWTAVALNDYAIKIVTSGNGGVTSGSVAYSTLFARVATDPHTLTTADTPLHTHFIANSDSSGSALLTNFLTRAGSVSGAGYALAGSSTSPNIGTTSPVGSGGSHTHGLDMRVQTAAFTLATRD